MAFKPSELVHKQREKDNGGSTVREGTEGHNKAHPGFKAVQSKIASERGVSEERAGAILGAATRHASPAAKAANPRLKRVKG
jgi:hypothetical protein